jgi:hypothetical protein
MAAHAQKADREADDDRDAMIVWSRAAYAYAMKITSTSPKASPMADAAAAIRFARAGHDGCAAPARPQHGCTYGKLRMGLDALEAAELIVRAGEKLNPSDA